MQAIVKRLTQADRPWTSPGPTRNRSCCHHAIHAVPTRAIGPARTGIDYRTGRVGGVPYGRPLRDVARWGFDHSRSGPASPVDGSHAVTNGGRLPLTRVAGCSHFCGGHSRDRGQCSSRPPTGTAVTCPSAGRCSFKLRPVVTSDERRRVATSASGIQAAARISWSGSVRRTPPMMARR